MSTAADTRTNDPVDIEKLEPFLPTARGRSAWANSLLRGRGLVGLALVGVVVLAGLLAPWLTPYGPLEQIKGANLVGASSDHWLGTDDLNRDVLTRMLHGIRVDLAIVFLCVPVGAVLGVLIGLVSAWWSWVDVLTQRVFDLILAFPALILAVLVAGICGPGIVVVAVVIISVELPMFGRLTRASVRSLRERPYVEAARIAGAGPWWLLRRHILPNSAEPLLVQLAVSMSVAVFIEGALSFLGLGVRPPAPSLGSMISQGIDLMYYAPLVALGPLVVVIALVLGLLLIAQSLSEADRD